MNSPEKRLVSVPSLMLDPVFRSPPDLASQIEIDPAPELTRKSEFSFRFSVPSFALWICRVPAVVYPFWPLNVPTLIAAGTVVT